MTRKELLKANNDKLREDLRMARKALKLTQGDVGKAIGCPHYIISNLEKGKTVVSIRMLKKLCKLYGIDVRKMIII